VATFTRIIHRRVGAVAVVDTYSIRGNFQPDAALRALSKVDEEPPAKVEPVTVNVDWPSALDPRAHPNCRSTMDPGFKDAADRLARAVAGKPTEVGGIMAARVALRQAVRDGKPIAERKRLQRRITTLLKARTRKARGHK
jgi:hypothetical protein